MAAWSFSLKSVRDLISALQAGSVSLPLHLNSTLLAALAAGTSTAVPSVTTTQRDALTAFEGLVVYNSTTKTLNVYNGTTWKAVTLDA